MVKIDEKMKNPYKNGEKPVFSEIPYVNSELCQKSVRLATLPKVYAYTNTIVRHAKTVQLE